MINKTCPICFSNPILSPNGVCSVCYDKLKKNEVHSKNQIIEAEKKFLAKYYPNATQETFEKRVESKMKFQKEQWEGMTQDGLSAVCLAVIVVDEAEHLPTWKEWHYRRVAFIKDLINCLPDSLFVPAPREQLNTYMNKALDHWNGRLTEEEREETYNDFKMLIDKKTSPSEWDEKSLPLWMMQKRESFDWMWEQFMDCIYECVPEKYELSDDEWMALYHKHFSDILEKWALKG